MLLSIGAWEKLLKQNGGTVGNIYIYVCIFCNIDCWECCKLEWCSVGKVGMSYWSIM